MNVLCIVSHPDDEVLGVGGTLARHADEGDSVCVHILSGGVGSRYDVESEAACREQTRRRHAIDACERLGVDAVEIHEFPDNEFDTVPLLALVQTVEAAVDAHDPDVVYTHHHGDLNIDHELTCRAVMTATRPLPDSGVERVFAFETLSSSEWSLPTASNAFQPTSFINIEPYLHVKVEALKQYENELEPFPHPRSVKAVRSAARLWGAKSGIEAAEAFEVLRELRN